MTEQQLLERSSLLEGALAKEQYMEFCEHKVQSSETEEDKNLWSFLKVTTEALLYDANFGNHQTEIICLPPE